MGVGDEKKLTDDESENGITQELQSLVVPDQSFGILVGKRPVGKGPKQNVLIPEGVSDPPFQIFEHKDC